MNSPGIRILNREDFILWDNFVDSSPQGDVFCYSWWLDTITRSNFRIYALFEKDEIVAGVPLAFDRHNKINEPPLTRTLGLLFKYLDGIDDHRKNMICRSWMNALLDEIPLNDFIQMCAHHTFTDWLPLRWRGLKQTTRYTYILHYNGLAEEQLRKKISRGKRSIINRAERNGIRVIESDDFELLYDYLGHTYRRQGIKFPVSYNDLKRLDESLKDNGNRIILRAYDRDNRTHAMIYLVYNKRSAYYLFSGSDEKLRNSGGHTLALWEAVKYFIDKVDYFNFGGSDIKRIEEHVRCFGGTLTPYFHIYNDRMIHIYDVRYHMKEIWFHFFSLFNALKYKLS